MLFAYLLLIVVGIILLVVGNLFFDIRRDNLSLLMFYFGCLILFLLGLFITTHGIPYQTSENVFNETLTYYGGMYYHNHTGTLLNFASDGYFYNLFMTNATHLNGFDYRGGFKVDSNLTANVSGTYLISYMASGDGQNNHEYYTSVFINNTNKDNCENHHKMTAGGDIITQTGTCLLNITAGNVISLRTADVGGTGNGNYYSANLDLVRIGK